MEYMEFKQKLVVALKDFYGADAEVSVVTMKKNNGQEHDGIQIIFHGENAVITPVFYMKPYFEKYRDGILGMDDCVEEIYRQREAERCPLIVRKLLLENVYPMLISTKENSSMLESLVSDPLLDLSIIYAARFDHEGCSSTIKIMESHLERLGVSHEKLRETAMQNLEKDGYSFRDICQLLPEQLGADGMDLPSDDIWENEGEMFVLTNKNNMFGAAGLLDKKLIRTFAQNRSFYIIPSSVHETLFVTAHDGYMGEEFDKMIREVNTALVSKEEQLSDHCYFYDSEMDEIRMCA